MPITEDRWTPAQPVRYMIHYEGSSLPSELKTQGETRVSGKIGGRLPTLIADRFREKGLHIEPSYVVLNWVEAGEVPSGTPAIDYDPAGIAFGVGIVMTFVTFASLALPRAAAKRSRAPKGHPSSRSTLGSRQRGRSAKCEAERQKMRPLTNYNEEVIDRLVAFERDRMPHASEEELHSAAYERLVRDNR